MRTSRQRLGCLAAAGELDLDDGLHRTPHPLEVEHRPVAGDEAPGLQQAPRARLSVDAGEGLLGVGGGVPGYVAVRGRMVIPKVPASRQPK